MKILKYIGIGFVALLIFQSCGSNDEGLPKPRGYFRIHYPQKTYRDFESSAPYTFSYPKYAEMETDKDSNAENYWYNMDFKQFNAKIHLSYYAIKNQKELDELTEDARKLVYKHTVKASGIDQSYIQMPERKVYGMIYDIDGNAASWIQFYVTDSSHHYLRGALYFNEKPQLDSLRPVVKFIEKDIRQLINTIQWKNIKK